MRHMLSQAVLARAARLTVAACAVAACAEAGCVKSVREAHEEVVATRAAAAGAVPVAMRTDYAALVDGLVGLRFTGDVPCTATMREEYVVHTHTVRTHTRAGVYSYFVAGGVALAGVGTGLALGLDDTRRDNVAA